MKQLWTALLGLATFGAVLFYLTHSPRTERADPGRSTKVPTNSPAVIPPPRPEVGLYPPGVVSPGESNVYAVARDFMRWNRDLSSDEKAYLEERFRTKIKPAIASWCEAYKGHVPLNAEDVTLDCFAQRLGRDFSSCIYSFVVNGITLCARDSGGVVVVNYLFTPDAKQLMRLPQGTVPSAETSVDRNEVIRMVQADTGIEFKPHEVELRPTGLGSAVNGGAFVNIGHLWGDPYNSLCKLSFVFGPDGKLMSYHRDPTF